MRKTRQKTNPAIEFKNDPMMRELHETRKKMSLETRDMDDNALREYFRVASKNQR